MSLTENYLLLAVPWLVVGGLRILRYARYFQQEGYEFERYRLWLSRNQAEKRYFVRCSVLLVVQWIILFAFLTGAVNWLLAAVLSTNYLLQGAMWSNIILLASNLVLAAVTLYLAPRDHMIKQKFAPTQRAVRLLITAFIVVAVWEMIPLLVAGLIDPAGPLVVRFVLVVVAVGIAVIVVSPLIYVVNISALPLANVINWPIEESLRQFYLARARRYLKRSGATVIAITGSYGKTSTKHYLNHILEGRFRVLMTPKSYNTLLGISRVINDVLSKDVSYEYFIVETDAYFVGENARICKLVEPQMGMIMTVGPMHLERLGSMENIEKAQYEVIQSLPPGGVGFFNGDDPAVRKMAGRGYPQTAIMVTKAGVPGAQIEALNVRMTAEGLDFDVRDNRTDETRSMHTPLYGDHNVTNILMATAVAHHLGMSLAEIGMRVTTLEPAEHRLIRRVLPDGIILIDDTYSANPVGTETALGVLALHKESPHRVVVSSGMFELGAVSEQENRKLGQRIADVATDAILIGATQTKAVKEGLVNCNFPLDHLHVVATLNEAVEIYRGILRPGDALLMLTDLPDTYA